MKLEYFLNWKALYALKTFSKGQIIIKHANAHYKSQIVQCVKKFENVEIMCKVT